MVGNMKDYSALIATHTINVSFTPAMVHVFTNNGKLRSQNNSATVKLSHVNGDKTKALYMAIDQLLGE